MFKIKLDPADVVFSQCIRLRDKRCVRCGKPVIFNDKGLPKSHQASHYFGRRKENTRFDPENVDTLCPISCHGYWEKEGRPAYMTFKIKQLTQAGFDRLQLRAHQYCKKDRQMALIQAKAWLKELRP